MNDDVFIHQTACVETGAQIGPGTKIWRHAHIRSTAIIGADCIIGMGVYIGENVTIGQRCKIQNYACIYGPSSIAEGVFIGPHAIITNDKYPRAITPDGELKGAEDWHAQGAMIQKGAAIGAGVIVLPGVWIGQMTIIGAGAIVTNHIDPNAIAFGTPAKVVKYIREDGYVKNDIN